MLVESVFEQEQHGIFQLHGKVATWVAAGSVPIRVARRTGGDQQGGDDVAFLAADRPWRSERRRRRYRRSPSSPCRSSTWCWTSRSTIRRTFTMPTVRRRPSPRPSICTSSRRRVVDRRWPNSTERDSSSSLVHARKYVPPAPHAGGTGPRRGPAAVELDAGEVRILPPAAGGTDDQQAHADVVHVVIIENGKAAPPPRSRRRQSASVSTQPA